MEEVQWERLNGEPIRWFKIFQKYYLSAGLGRSVRKAYLGFQKETGQEEYEKALLTRGVPNTWRHMSQKWHWHERADAWEEAQTEESMAIVKEAAKQLRLATVDAVKALVILLSSERYGVQAANSILDRGGLPAKQLLESVERVFFTSDDMNEAVEEVKEWEKEQFETSG